MTKLWCKLWNFFLNIFTSAIEGIGYLLATLGTVLVEILGAVGEAVSEVFSGSGAIPLFVGGLLLFMFFKKKKEEPVKKKDEPINNKVAVRT